MHTSQATPVESCEGARHIVPSPLVGEGQGGGWRWRTTREAISSPRFGYRESLERAFSGIELETAAEFVVPPSLSLPHKGGRNDVALLGPNWDPAYALRKMCACLSAKAGTHKL